MTWRAFLLGLVRTRLINAVTVEVLIDIDTNGLSVDDEAIINNYLDQTKPV